LAQRITITLDEVQAAWLDALAELHRCSRPAVLRQALLHLSALESRRVARTRRYRLISIAAEIEDWDPITDYLRNGSVKGS
jgi:predicted transcriptional regulator